MAKELPYFKFEPSAWENGKIQMCSREDRGLFIELCSMYWQRLGDLPFRLAVQKLCGGNASAFSSLCEEKVFTVIDDHVCINFLNEQLNEFEDLSNQNRVNALKGWEKRKNGKGVMRPHSERNANAMPEEKRRGDEIKEKKSIEKESDSEIKMIIENLVKSGLSEDEAQRKANEIYETDKIEFQRFTEWVKDNAESVSKMPKPFTQLQYVTLREKLGKDAIRDYVLKMDNYKPLLQKNKSAYQTLLNWQRRNGN